VKVFDLVLEIFYWEGKNLCEVIKYLNPNSIQLFIPFMD